MKKNIQNILLVEDEAIIGLALAAELEDAGYQVADIIHTGEEALEFLKKRAVDVVILDVMLGDGIDGLETLQEIRKICSPPPYIFIISGNSDAATVQKIKKMGVDGFFVKPVNTQALFYQLRKIMG